MEKVPSSVHERVVDERFFFKIPDFFVPLVPKQFGLSGNVENNRAI
jgi:hypothetical protein